jgi:hypothetical protein
MDGMRNPDDRIVQRLSLAIFAVLIAGQTLAHC